MSVIFAFTTTTTNTTTTTTTTASMDNNDDEWGAMEDVTVVGTCTDLEKEYFRLNEAPHPSTVRPEAVLRQALHRLKSRLASKEVDYEPYGWSQLKAIRQDLLVQHIRNSFAVEVYETHARIALENGDLNEYNQCQTQLFEHYQEGISGSELEFLAYRILYYVYLGGNPKYQEGDRGMLKILAELTPEVGLLLLLLL